VMALELRYWRCMSRCRCNDFLSLEMFLCDTLFATFTFFGGVVVDVGFRGREGFTGSTCPMASIPLHGTDFNK
jgi:hypothetical protein